MNLFIIIYYAWLDLLNSIAEKEEEGGTIDAENRAFNYLQENGTWIPCSLPCISIIMGSAFEAEGIYSVTKLPARKQTLHCALGKYFVAHKILDLNIFSHLLLRS